MKRLTLFSFFDPENQIDKYVVHYLTELKKVSDIIFSSDCNLNKNELRKINHLVLYSICEKHGEYDFGSHKRSYLKAKQLNILKNYDWLLLVNDSCYGPFCELTPIFYKMEKNQPDFWGFTNNTIDLQPHLQSYFVTISKKAFHSKTFDSFLQGITKESERRNIILKYEHGLTTCLVQAGFSHSSFFEESPESFINDPSWNWENMIQNGFPFLKRSLFTRNTYHLTNLNSYKEIIFSKFPDFDSQLIMENLNKYTLESDRIKSYKLSIKHLKHPYFIFKLPFWFNTIVNRKITTSEFTVLINKIFDNKLNKKEIKHLISFYKKH